MKAKKRFRTKLIRLGSTRRGIAVIVIVLVTVVGSVYVFTSRASAAGLSTDSADLINAGLDSTGQLCESYGHHYCADTADFNYGTAVRGHVNGRTMKFIKDGNFMDFTKDGYNLKNMPTGTLAFPDRDNKCADASGSKNIVEVNQCKIVTGDIWAAFVDNGHLVFVNRHYSNYLDRLQVLSAFYDNDYKFRVQDYRTYGSYQKFYFK